MNTTHRQHILAIVLGVPLAAAFAFPASARHLVN
jgi:hypothetical protein